MSLSWREIRTHKFTLLSGPLLCLAAVLLLLFLYRLEQISRAAIHQDNVIIVEAEREADADTGQFDEPNSVDLPSESANSNTSGNLINDGLKKESLPQVLQERYQKLAKTKSRAVGKPSDFLSGIPSVNYNKLDRQLFYELLANNFVRKKKYTLAVEIFTAIPGVQFLQKRSSYSAAIAHSKLGQTSKALVFYQMQLEENPNHQANAMNYALLLTRLKEHEKSIEIFEHAASITSGTRKAKALRYIGEAHFSLGRVDAAIAAYRKSIIFEPDSSKAWLLLAKALAAMDGGEAKDSAPEVVVKTMQKAISLKPNDYKARLGLANYYFSQLDYELARVEYAAAAKRASGLPELRIAQALNLYASARPYSAKKVLKKMRDTNTADELVEKFIGYMGANQYRRALAALKKMRTLRKLDKELLVYLQMLYYAEKTKADPLSKGRVETTPQSIYYWPTKLLLAKYLYKRNRFKDASAIGSEILNTIPNSAEALLIQGKALNKGGQQKQALQKFAQAYNLQKNSRRISTEYIHQLMQAQDIAMAMSVVDEVIELHPNYKTALRLKAELLEQDQQMDNAMQLLEQLFSREDGSSADGIALARLQCEMHKADLCLQTLSELLEFDTANIPARILRAETLLKQSRFIDSETEVKLILRLEPENESATQIRQIIKNKTIAKSTNPENAIQEK